MSDTSAPRTPIKGLTPAGETAVDNTAFSTPVRPAPIRIPQIVVDSPEPVSQRSQKKSILKPRSRMSTVTDHTGNVTEEIDTKIAETRPSRGLSVTFNMGGVHEIPPSPMPKPKPQAAVHADARSEVFPQMSSPLTIQRHVSDPNLSRHRGGLQQYLSKGRGGRRGSWSRPASKLDRDTTPVTLHGEAAQYRKQLITGTPVKCWYKKLSTSSRPRKPVERKFMHYSTTFGGVLYIFPTHVLRENQPTRTRDSGDVDQVKESKPLFSFDEIYVGAQTIEFGKDNSPSYRTGPEDPSRCFTLSGMFGSVAIECRNTRECQVWVAGIHAILKARGKQIAVHRDLKFFVTPIDSARGFFTTDKNLYPKSIKLNLSCSKLFPVQTVFSKRRPLLQVFLKAPYSDEFHFVGQTEADKTDVLNPDFKTEIKIEYESNEQMIMIVLSYEAGKKDISRGKYRYGYVAVRLQDVAGWVGTAFTYNLANKGDATINEKLVKHGSTVTIVCNSYNHESMEFDNDGVTALYKQHQSLVNLFVEPEEEEDPAAEVKHTASDSKLHSSKRTNNPSKPVKYWNKVRSMFAGKKKPKALAAKARLRMIKNRAKRDKWLQQKAKSGSASNTI